MKTTTNRSGNISFWVKQGFGKYWTITNESEKADFEVNNLTELLALL